VEDGLDIFYRDHYSNFIETGLVGFAAKLSHRSLEVGQSSKRTGEQFRILEVGAGGGQHVKFCNQDYSEYILTDLRPENLPKSEGRVISNKDIVPADCLPYSDQSFDRVIATCLVAHLNDPNKAVGEWLRVVKDSGNITIYVPCEPGFILRILQHVITNKKKKKMGIANPKLLHYRDHIQTYVRLKEEIQHLSANVKIRRYPFPMLSWNFNLWAVFHITK
jgi:phosphatidylethanolamine/phosphatidyl-N-methylethanolamine N-methyltransferase